MATGSARDVELGARRRVKTRRTLPVLLERHREALDACRRCAHHDDVLPILADARSPRAMLVGQAPGKSEMTGRRAFSGRAGRTLFRWFEQAGLDETRARQLIYFAAVTRCYPGPHPSGRGDRVPSGPERAACRSWLEDELRIIRPPLLILVGRLAIAEFLPATPLDAVVGRVRVVDHEGGRSRVVALPHPSGASSWLHVPANAALLERAIGALRTELARLDIVTSRARRAS